MLKKMSLKKRMLLLICSMAVFVFASTIAIITVQMREMAKVDAIDKASLIAYKYSEIVKDEMGVAMNVARVTASVFEGVKISEGAPDRDSLSEVLKQLLEKNKSFLGTWTCWEPNTLDGRDADFVGKSGHDTSGRFIPYWNRSEKGIALDPLLDYEKPGAGDYYLLPKQTGEEVVINPYPYVIGGKEVLLTSLAVPIRYDGQIVGVVGVDIALDSLNTLINRSEQIFGASYISLVSNSAVYVAHPKPERIGKNMVDTDPWVVPYLTKIKNGESFFAKNYSKTLDSFSYRICVPVVLGEAKTPWAIILNVSEKEVLAASKRITLLSIWIGIISVVVFGLITLLIANSIVGPINIITESLKDIAQGDGDLRKRLKINSSDEIGELSKWFNVFIEKIHGIIVDIADNSKKLDDSSGGLLSLAQKISEEVKGVSSKSSAVTKATEGMSVDISSVAAAAEESSANMGMVAAAIEEMTSTINEIAQNTEETRGKSDITVSLAQKVFNDINSLKEANQAIKGVLGAINDISEQTNLLALNATIEAARAGDAGKGFAVVANEIKELAKQAASATNDIAAKIMNIEELTDGTVSQINGMTAAVEATKTMIDAVAAAVEEQSATTEEISNNVIQADQATREVTGRMSQSSIAAKRITGHIAEVDLAAQSIMGDSARINSDANELKKLSGKLKSIVGQFKI